VCDLVHHAFGDRVPAAALIRGSPGSGKTRLLTELQAVIPVTEQVSIGGYQPEQEVPLACARGLLQRLSRAPGGEAVEEVAFGPPSAAAPVEAVRLFEAAHRAVAALGPAVVLVDDLQWADDTSLALLHYVLRAAHAARVPVGVVAASRPSGTASEFLATYRRLLGADRVLDVELGPLDAEDGIRLAQDLSPGLDEAEARKVWEASAGSPFWLEHLATTDQREARVATLVTAALAPVGAAARTTLEVLAIASRPVTPDELADMQRWPPDRVEQAVAALEGRGLVRLGTGSISVVHDLVRDAILEMVPPERAMRLHRRVGTWVEEAAGEDLQLLLTALDHLRRGGGSTIGLALRLARSPGRRLLGDAGMQRLIAILDDADTNHSNTSELHRLLAALASELGRHDEALRLWSRLASTSGNPVEAARAALRASDAAMALSESHEAWRLVAQARQVASDPAVAVEILAQEASLRWFLEHKPQEARSAANAALAASRTLADHSGGMEHVDQRTRSSLLRALQAAIDSALITSDLVAMLALADELAYLAAGLDDRTYLRAMVYGALALRLQGRTVEAESRLRRAWLDARRKVMPQAMLDVGTAFSQVLISTGRLEEAEAIVAECLALGDRLMEYGPSRAFMAVLPSVGVSRGNWRQAVDGLRRSAAAEPDPHYRQHAQRERAAALAWLDPKASADEVREAVSAALTDAGAAGCQRCVAETTVVGAEALARIGDPDASRSLLAGLDVPPMDAFTWVEQQRCEAAIAAASGDVDRAIAIAEQAAAEFERQGQRLPALRTRLDLGALVTHDRRRAVALLRDAAATAERMGALTEQRIAERQLRALGVRAWRRSATAGGDDPLAVLTDREREIATLVSRGATNPEIAATVFVSRKTVEHHVSSILAKLGLRNRSELAGLLAERLEEDAPGR
jgi:DNA-binding NarL/FixJ family response regulator